MGFLDWCHAVVLWSKFLKKLKASGIQQPNEEVLGKIKWHFLQAAQIAVADSGNTDVRKLYDHAADMPRVSTIQAIQAKAGILFLPTKLDASHPLLSEATGVNGESLVVKLLRPSTDKLMSPEADAEERTMEAVAAETFGKHYAGGVALAKMELVVATNAKKSYQVIVMPKYTTSLAGAGLFPRNVLLAQGRRIRAALKVIHDKGFVHMDVKPANIFVDAVGAWALGDFGSMKRIGQPITSTTVTSHPQRLLGKPADPKYDEFALGLALLYLANQSPREAFDRFMPEGQLEKAGVDAEMKILEPNHRELHQFIGELFKADPSAWETDTTILTLIWPPTSHWFQ